jgi:hypothetical protein
MSGLRSRAHDERGLIGKIIVLWIALGIAIVLLAYDGVQIGITRFKAADAAQSAAFEASSVLRANGPRAMALEAAQQVVDEAGVRMTGFVIDDATGQVTVTVTRKAPTLIIGKLFFEDLAKAKATDTSEVPQV